jgi:hypothetical protein
MDEPFTEADAEERAFSSLVWSGGMYRWKASSYERWLAPRS